MEYKSQGHFETNERKQIPGTTFLTIMDNDKIRTDQQIQETQKQLNSETNSLLERVQRNSMAASQSLSLIDSSSLLYSSPPKYSASSPEKQQLMLTETDSLSHTVPQFALTRETGSNVTESAIDREMKEIRSRSRANFVTKLQDKSIDKLKIQAQVCFYCAFVIILPPCLQTTVNELETSYLRQIEQLKQDNLELAAQAAVYPQSIHNSSVHYLGSSTRADENKART